MPTWVEFVPIPALLAAILELWRREGKLRDQHAKELGDLRNQHAKDLADVNERRLADLAEITEARLDEMARVTAAASGLGEAARVLEKAIPAPAPTRRGGSRP